MSFKTPVKRGRSLSRSSTRSASKSTSVTRRRVAPRINPGFVPRVARLFNSGALKVHKKCYSAGACTIVPSTGINYSLLTAGYTLALSFDQQGAIVYQPSAGGATTGLISYPDNANYTAVFDQWRINSVTVKGYFSNNYSSVSGVATALPLWYTAVDFDGGVAAVTTSAQVLQYANSKVHKSGSGSGPSFSRTLVPRIVNNMTGNIITGNNYGIMPEKTWCDSASPLAPHWGLILAYDNENATQATAIGTLTIIVEIEYEYRGSR